MKLRVRARGPLSRAEREALALLWERERRRKGGPRLSPGSLVPCPEADGRMVPAGADYPGGRALACVAGRREVVLGSGQRRARVQRDLRRMETVRVRRTRVAELQGPAMPRRVAEVSRRAEMGARWWASAKGAEDRRRYAQALREEADLEASRPGLMGRAAERYGVPLGEVMRKSVASQDRETMLRARAAAEEAAAERMARAIPEGGIDFTGPLVFQVRTLLRRMKEKNYRAERGFGGTLVSPTERDYGDRLVHAERIAARFRAEGYPARLQRDSVLIGDPR